MNKHDCRGTSGCAWMVEDEIEICLACERFKERETCEDTDFECVWVRKAHHCISNECTLDTLEEEADIRSCTDMQGQCGFWNLDHPFLADYIDHIEERTLIETARDGFDRKRVCIPCFVKEAEEPCNSVIGCRWDRSRHMCLWDSSKCRWNYDTGRRTTEVECPHTPRCFWNIKYSECDACEDIFVKDMCLDTNKCVWRSQSCIPDPCLIHNEKEECYADLPNDCTWLSQKTCVSCNGFSEKQCYDIHHCKWIPLGSCLDAEFTGQCRRKSVKPCTDPPSEPPTDPPSKRPTDPPEVSYYPDTESPSRSPSDPPEASYYPDTESPSRPPTDPPLNSSLRRHDRQFVTEPASGPSKSPTDPPSNSSVRRQDRQVVTDSDSDHDLDPSSEPQLQTRNARREASNSSLRRQDRQVVTDSDSDHDLDPSSELHLQTRNARREAIERNPSNNQQHISI